MGLADICERCGEPWLVPLDAVWNTINDRTKVAKKKFALACAHFLVEMGGAPWRERVWDLTQAPTTPADVRAACVAALYMGGEPWRTRIRDLTQAPTTPADVRAACKAALKSLPPAGGRLCPEPFQQKPRMLFIVDGQRVGMLAWRCLACGGLMFAHGGQVNDTNEGRRRIRIRVPDNRCRACRRISWSRSASTLMVPAKRVFDRDGLMPELADDRDGLMPELAESLAELLGELDEAIPDHAKIRRILRDLELQVNEDREFLRIVRASDRGDLTTDDIERLRALIRQWITWRTE